MSSPINWKFTPPKRYSINEPNNLNYSPNNFQFCNPFNSRIYSQNNYNIQKNNSYYSKDNLNEINNNNPNINYEYNKCYILITKFDNYSKDALYNFIEQQGIYSRDIKIFNNKIIIAFPNLKSRQQFINEYNKVSDNFYGLELKFIDENEKEEIINNNTNRIIHNISYNNNYINNENNMIQLPPRKSTFKKFLDVFFNL